MYLSSNDKESLMKFARITVGMLGVGMLTLGALDYRPGAGLAQTADPSAQPKRSELPVLINGNNFIVQGYQANEANVDHQVGALIGEYSKTQDEAKRASIKSQLSVLLDKQFDAQQKHRETEVKNIEDQLKKLRDILKKRSDNQQSIVKNHLEQLLREAEGLGWAPPHTGNTNFNFGNSPYTFQRGNGLYSVPSLTVPAVK
jgi:hypothetical protein